MSDLPAGARYVAMGSSFAAGVGIGPRVVDGPRRAGRSQRNYAHLLAAELGLDLVDVSYSGATAAQVVDGGQTSTVQVDALTAQTRLVTITCGGNDVGYIGRLFAASLPRPLRGLPAVRRRIAELDAKLEAAFAELPATFDRLLGAVTQRAPQARIVLVDYLTVLPPTGSVPGLADDVVDRGRASAARLAAETAAAAGRAGCLLISAAAASQDHHAWSEQPWTTRFRFGRGAGVPYHPNAAGMAAIAALLVERLAAPPSPVSPDGCG